MSNEFTRGQGRWAGVLIGVPVAIAGVVVGKLSAGIVGAFATAATATTVGITLGCLAAAGLAGAALFFGVLGLAYSNTKSPMPLVAMAFAMAVSGGVTTHLMTGWTPEFMKKTTTAPAFNDAACKQNAVISGREAVVTFKDCQNEPKK